MTDKKRIAFLCHPYHRGGVTRWMADAAVAAADSGMDVYFITVEPANEFISGGGRERMYDLLKDNKSGVKVIARTVNFTFEFGSEAYRADIYSSLVRGGVPAGVPIVVSDDAAVWAAAGSIADKYPMIGVLHADEPYYYTIAKKYNAQVAVLVCVSERIKKTVLGFSMIVPQSVYTIPCGINLPAADFNRKEHDTLKLVYAGRISEYQKRTSDLLKVAVLLRQNKVPFHMEIIGSGPEQIALENKTREAGLESAITFRGWLSQKEVSKSLSESDLFLLTSDFEGTPIAMMEALAAGCGMVGTRVSGIEDYERHPMAANCLALYIVGDTESAVAAIMKIAAIPAKTRQEAGRKIAEAEFSMEVCLARYNAALAGTRNTTAAARNVNLSALDKLKSNGLALGRFLKTSVIKQKQ